MARAQENFITITFKTEKNAIENLFIVLTPIFLFLIVEIDLNVQYFTAIDSSCQSTTEDRI